jgi:chorismate lyase/3-hydroxybenzoate synthase
MDRLRHAVLSDPRTRPDAPLVLAPRRAQPASHPAPFEESGTAGLVPPAWATGLAGPFRPVRLPSVTGAPGVRVMVASGPSGDRGGHGGQVVVAGGVLPGAWALNGARFQRATRELINLVLEQVFDSAAPHLVRMWSFVPGIDQPTDHTFNAGWFEAFTALLSRPERFDQTLPTASCVGHDQHDLAIYALGSDHPGTAVENPRQIPAFRYSSRFGARPPCFARATRTRLAGREALLIGGTASVVGEDSAHLGDPYAQLNETIANLCAVAAVAPGPCPGRAWSLADATSARAYVVAPALDELVKRGLEPALSRSPQPACTLELTRATVCRPELLVEVEAVLECPA